MEGTKSKRHLDYYLRFALWDCLVCAVSVCVEGTCSLASQRRYCVTTTKKNHFEVIKVKELTTVFVCVCVCVSIIVNYYKHDIENNNNILWDPFDLILDES